jgi:CheY-like chemotaxis protein
MNFSPPTGCLAGRHILVVEDDELLAAILVENLAEFGCIAIGPVASLAAATALVRQERVDAAILDINLRGESVYPFTRELASRRVPFILTTGYEPDSIAWQYGQSSVLQKPFTLTDLGQSLSKAMQSVAANRGDGGSRPRPSQLR